MPVYNKVLCFSAHVQKFRLISLSSRAFHECSKTVPAAYGGKTKLEMND